MNRKTTLLIGAIALIITLAMAIVLHWLGGFNPQRLQHGLLRSGPWMPLLYILVYVIATLCVFPSTPLNLSGGALFGLGYGMVWTGLAAMLAAIVTFGITRTIGRKALEKRLSGQWQAIDAEVRRGGVFYMIAIRLVPMMPYGLLNFAAALTSVSFRDFLVGTLIGTLPGLLPYVWLGSSGVQALKTGDVIPLMGAMLLTAVFIAGTTWYRRSNR